VKLLDFGISKVTTPGGHDQGMTRTTAIMGSPLYMSPEQIRSSKTVDARSDVWSLGVILHELLAGRPPFEGDGAPSVFASITADPPVPLQSVAPHVPAALAALVARCLEKSPDARPASVAELARGLLPFAPAEGRGSVERITTVLGESGATTIDPTSSLGHADTIHAATPLATGTDWGRTGERRAPRALSRPSLLAGAALLAVLAGVTGVLVLRPVTKAVEAPSSASAPAVDAAAPPPPSAPAAPAAAPAESASASASAPTPSASSSAPPQRRGGTRPAPAPPAPPTPDLRRTEF
jgi:serine/threonine-protein kinase